MPIEVRELIIKAEVAHRDGGNRESSESSSSGTQDQEAIIKACVERIMEILKEKMER